MRTRGVRKPTAAVLMPVKVGRTTLGSQLGPEKLGFAHFDSFIGSKSDLNGKADRACASGDRTGACEAVESQAALYTSIIVQLAAVVALPELVPFWRVRHSNRLA